MGSEGLRPSAASENKRLLMREKVKKLIASMSSKQREQFLKWKEDKREELHNLQRQQMQGVSPGLPK